jgi:hypothetical protein
MLNDQKILISHRGNINGKNIELENKPDYIDKAINLGYNVEIDVWVKNRELLLGHDEPIYKIDIDWVKFRSNLLWIHCKNVEAIIFFKENNYEFNYFWHENDTVTLTSKNYIWAYPGKQPIKNSIAIMPEIYDDNVSECMGICSDFIKKYEEYLILNK